MPPPDTMTKLRLLAGYLACGPGMRHAAAVKEELTDFLQQIEISNQAALVILSLGDPELYDLVQKRAGRTLFTDLTDIHGDPMDVIEIVNFEKFHPASRTPMLDRLLSVSKLSDHEIAPRLMTQAMEAADPDFAEKVFEEFPQIGTQAYLSIRNIEGSGPGAGPIWQRLFAELDLASADVSDFAAGALRQQNARATALLLKVGFPVLNIGGTFMPKGGPWPDRMFQRLQSAHEKLTFIASLPDINVIVDMDETEARLLLGGPSKKEIRRARREAKQARQNTAE